MSWMVFVLILMGIFTVGGSIRSLTFSRMKHNKKFDADELKLNDQIEDRLQNIEGAAKLLSSDNGDTMLKRIDRIEERLELQEKEIRHLAEENEFLKKLLDGRN
jgi:hypothetical protein